MVPAVQDVERRRVEELGNLTDGNKCYVWARGKCDGGPPKYVQGGLVAVHGEEVEHSRI